MWQRVNQAGLEALEHGEGVLVCVDVLPPAVAVPQVLHVRQVGGDSLGYLLLLVSGVLGEGAERV